MNIDERIISLVNSNKESNNRSLLVLLGARAKEQIPIIYKLAFKVSPNTGSVVHWWSHENSNNRNSKNKNPKNKYYDEFDKTHLVVHYDYKNSTEALGSSCNACIFQNFEAITPNVLAQGIETVRGGGLVIFLVENVKAVHDLLNIKMDLHERFKTSSGMEATPRFTERFLISLTRCQSCLIVDEELQVLSHWDSSLWNKKHANEDSKPEQLEIQELACSLLEHSETTTAGSLVKCCATMDQVKAVLALIGSITNKSLPSTVVMTAARGRGKSASLGLGIAAAIAYKFGDIYITAPSPENLGTVFDYIETGLRALNFSDNEFKKIWPSCPKPKHCLGFEVFRDHVQKVEYIRPEDHRLIAGAKILCIDEAAAIPMTYVKEMMAARYVFMSSTVNGYEGTGRSLSHKLISDLRQKVSVHETGVEVAKVIEKIKKNMADDFNELGNRVLHEIELSTPVRYGPHDHVEPWLNGLLCLNTGGEHAARECPYPSSCELYYVNKDTLFSGHEKTEEFLQELISVFAASHYKNSPNDVMMLSDAPNHHVFCLMGPAVKTSDRPTILCALQVAYEGGLDQKTVSSALRKGTRGDGDLIPWIIEEKYSGRGFAQMLGVRVVRIATHPGLQRGGYGSRAVELLTKYFEGRLMDLEMKEEETVRNITASELVAAHSKQIKPRTNLPPLMVELGRRRPERMDYIGASFGFTTPLLRFWKKQGMVAVNLSMTKNTLTGDYNGIVLKPIKHVEDDLPDDDVNMDADDDDDNDHQEESKGVVLPQWLMGIVRDFQQSLLDTLTDVFRGLETTLALEMLKNVEVKMPTTALSKEELSKYFLADEDVLLENYMKDLCGEKQITTLVYTLAYLLFSGKLGLRLTELKEIIFLGMGIQRKTAEEMIADLPNTDVEERRAFYKQAIMACIMKKSGEDSSIEDAEEEDKKKESLKEKLDLVQQLRDDMEDAIEVGKQRHKALEEFKVTDIKGFSIGGGKDDLWKKEVEKVGKKSKSNILKRKAGDESELVKNMKKKAGKRRKK